MSVSREEIEKVAHLARIAINEDNIVTTTDSINRVLSLVDQLQAADTDGIEPMAHPLDVAQRLRSDVVTESNQRQAFLAQAPETEADLFLVPKVIE